MPLLLAEDELEEAWLHVQDNEGCAGADGVTIERFAQRAPKELLHLQQRLSEDTYRAFPLLKIVVEKRTGPSSAAPNQSGTTDSAARNELRCARVPQERTGPGSAAPNQSGATDSAARSEFRGARVPQDRPGAHKTRTLLVPAVRDRVLQTAIARRLSKSFEDEFLECSYGYRPHRSVDRAIARIRKLHEMGYSWLVDADIQTFFDKIDHSLLLHRLALHQPGEFIMNLVREWVEAAVWDGQHLYRLREGVPQGSPISPLLANFFLEDFDRELEKSGRKLIRYADDFLVLTKTEADAADALQLTARALADAHLALNQEKTRIVNFDTGFQFLGALFQKGGIWVP
jgi:retron-type reverse transcriptase